MENLEDQAIDIQMTDSTENHAEAFEETSAEVLNNEGEESALLENEEPIDDGAQPLNESLLEESDAQEGDAAQPSGEVEGNDAVIEDSMDEGREGEEEKEEEEDKEEEIKLSDNEMPQVNVATLAKRKWQVKIYPLKPDDFMSGQISRVFSNAKESLLYILSSGKFSGGKGEMYVSSGMQAARVVHNLMKLDFKSQNINIEIIRKNDEGVVEEKAFLRFDAKLIRILCVPMFKNRRLGSRRERIIGSVFVKNLPNGTSKDMLRVMFPFAPEINYSPEKFHDGTARLVLSTRSAVAPCLKGFTKLELGDTLLEMRPLQKKSLEAGETDSTKKTEDGEEAGSQSETDGKTVDTKKEEKGSPRVSSEKTSGKSPAAKKSPVVSKPADGKKQEKKPETGKPRFPNRNTRDLGANRNRYPRDNRRDGGIRTGTYRPRGGGQFAQRGGDRNRFRVGGFGNRVRLDDRRMRMPGAGRDVGINTGAAKEMLLLQGQLSVAIKNQLSMLNQTQFALEQAKREAATINFTRQPVPASSSGVTNRRVSNQMRTEQARGGQMKTDNRRQQNQNKRGKPRERRVEGRHFGGGGGGDYSYKRNADMAGLQAGYGASGLGKRRSTGLGGHTESYSWADERAAPAFGHPQQAAFGYGNEYEEREAEFQSLHAGLSPRSLNYSQSNYGYRY